MKKIYLSSLVLATSAFLFSACAQNNLQTKNTSNIEAYCKLDPNPSGDFMLRESNDKCFSKVYYTYNRFNTNAVNKGIELISNKISLSEDEYRKVGLPEKVEIRYIKKTKDFNIYLETSLEQNVPSTFHGRDSHVKMDKKITLLDTYVYNHGQKPLELSEEFVKNNFKNRVAFWFSEDDKNIKPNSFSRLVVVVGGTEHFNVQKKQGSSMLNFKTKRVIENKELKTNK